MKSPYRGTAIAVGVLLIACSAASILSIVPLGSMLDAPVDLASVTGSLTISSSWRECGSNVYSDTR